MISDKKERPKVLAAAEEVQTISRSMLVWANTFPDKPLQANTFWADIKRNISLKCSIESNRETA